MVTFKNIKKSRYYRLFIFVPTRLVVFTLSFGLDIEFKRVKQLISLKNCT